MAEARRHTGATLSTCLECGLCGAQGAGAKRVTVLDPSFEPSLHVFEQDGGWQWALTVKRATGVGVKVVAFSQEGFRGEAEAYAAGQLARAEYDAAVTA
ncbi:hypothetical protein BSE24067_03364 [Burkholderia seminalis]|nr:hypothetical protein BSE24067_03364 [Burkholderia seminalis]